MIVPSKYMYIETKTSCTPGKNTYNGFCFPVLSIISEVRISIKKVFKIKE